MKRNLYLFPLMAFTAATFVLAGCDDKKDQEQNASTETTVPATSTMPAVNDTAATTTTTTMAPVAAAVTAEGATAYATTEGTTTGAVFLTLHNTGADADKLVGATSDKGMVEIHENSVGPDGTMQMRKVDTLDVPAGQQLTLKSDGYHLMLMGLTAPLMQGDTFNVTLNFEKAPAVTVPVTVVAPGAADAGSTGADATMDHSNMGAMGTTDSTTTTTDTTSTPDVTPAPEGAMTAPSTDTTTTTPSSDVPADEQSAE